MRTYFLYILLLSGICLSSCGSKNNDPAPQLGVILNPVRHYQESYPGQIVSFKVKVNTASGDPLTTFQMRFKMPGATDFVALPEYPDVTQNAQALFGAYQTFEYAVPGSAVVANTSIMIKFIAKTAIQSYEGVDTVKILNIGLQRARLWSPALTTYFKLSTIDLPRAVAVPASIVPYNPDMIPVTTILKNPVNGQTSVGLIGWTSGNGTKFKPATAANYNGAVSQYATIYAGIAAANELSSVTTLGTPTLAANLYYIAKVNRNNVFSYVGILVKKSPTITALALSSTISVDPLQEYLEIEIKNN
jgi:hypothetical protein